MFLGNKAFWLGAIGSAVFLGVFVVLFVDFDTIGDVVTGANYAYVAPSLVFYFIAVWFRSQRWKFLLRGPEADHPEGSRIGALAGGRGSRAGSLDELHFAGRPG